MAVFWDDAPDSLTIEASGILNVGKFLSDCTTLRTRRQPFSYFSPWELRILLDSISSADSLKQQNSWKFCVQKADNMLFI
jgi:hypothetical protein